tara:strand:+ start:7945 stop:8475 length:531 start_codon:yes stop_codon:yes gene_type:complete
VHRDSKIISTHAGDSVTIERDIDFGNVVGRQVIQFSPYCGTYGQGGPGFVGFKLKAHGERPEEWLILCLWCSDDWLTVNGRWLGAHPDQYGTQKPMISNFSGQKWDEFTPLVVGSAVGQFDVEEKSCEIRIGEAHIVLSDDPNDRPPYLAGKLRELMVGDDLRRAWILASAPWVQV